MNVKLTELFEVRPPKSKDDPKGADPYRFQKARSAQTSKRKAAAKAATKAKGPSTAVRGQQRPVRVGAGGGVEPATPKPRRIEPRRTAGATRWPLGTQRKEPKRDTGKPGPKPPPISATPVPFKKIWRQRGRHLKVPQDWGEEPLSPEDKADFVAMGMKPWMPTRSPRPFSTDPKAPPVFAKDVGRDPWRPKAGEKEPPEAVRRAAQAAGDPEPSTWNYPDVQGYDPHDVEQALSQLANMTRGGQDVPGMEVYTKADMIHARGPDMPEVKWDPKKKTDWDPSRTGAWVFAGGEKDADGGPVKGKEFDIGVWKSDQMSVEDIPEAPEMTEVFMLEKEYPRAGVKYDDDDRKKKKKGEHAVGSFDPFGTRGDVSFFPGAGGGGNGGAVGGM